MDVDPLKISETERPLRTEQPVNLQSEIWHLMRRHARAIQAAREEAGRKEAREHDRLRALVVDLSRAYHQLKVFLEQHTAAMDGAGLREQAGVLATIRDRYEQVLTRAGADLFYLDPGQPFTFDLEDRAKIMGWIPSEGVDQPRVHETVSPGVKLNAELVHRAEVVVAVPSPAQTGGRSAPAEEPHHERQETTDESRDRD